jgi:hypothetical protein
VKQIGSVIFLFILGVTVPSFYFTYVLGITDQNLVFAYSMVAVFIGTFFILAIIMIIRSKLYG